MSMNGSVKLGISLPSLLTALAPKKAAAAIAPLPPMNPVVSQTEMIGLVGGVGLFAAGTQVKGNPGVLMKIVGLVAGLVSGYIITVKKGVIPDVINAGVPSPAKSGGSAFGPLAPLKPGAAAQRPTAASDAAAIVSPFAPVIQKIFGPSSSANTNQQQQANAIKASSPVAAAAARAVSAPSATSENPYGIVTQADLEKSISSPSSSSNPYGIVTEADLRTMGPPSPGVPGMVTQIDEDSGSAPPSIPGFVAPSEIYSAPEPEPPPIDIMTSIDGLMLAGISNGS